MRFFLGLVCTLDSFMLSSVPAAPTGMDSLFIFASGVIGLCRFHLLDIVFELDARYGYVTTAALTSYTDIRAYAEYIETVASARMILLHYQYVARHETYYLHFYDRDLRSKSSFLAFLCHGWRSQTSVENRSNDTKGV